MGEEVKISDQCETNGGDAANNNGDEERVTEWERGLPTVDDLTPLSQPLIPPELASAFSITPEPCRTSLDVNRASQSTFSTLRSGGGGEGGLNNFKSFNEDRATTLTTDPMVVEAVEEEEEEEGEEENNGADREAAGSESRKLRKVESEEADSALRTENSAAAKPLKRPRLMWTPQLHKRFVDVVAHLGTKSAVPKTVMQLMNVEGLTRENVASHLQKYRLYLKRMQGLSNEGPSSSDHLFASTPVPKNLHESSRAGGEGDGGGSTNGGGGWGGGGGANANGHMGMPIPVPYYPGIGAMMPMPGYGHMGMQIGNHHHHHLPHHQPNGFDGSVPYNMLQRDGNANNYGSNNYGSVMSYPHHHHPHHVAHNDNM